MIERDWNQEGKILTITSDRRGSRLDVYWNADTPERSSEISFNEEIYIYLTSYINNRRTDSSSTTLSMIEAKELRDTLDYMINALENLKENE